jgi:hypothetical protein
MKNHNQNSNYHKKYEIDIGNQLQKEILIKKNIGSDGGRAEAIEKMAGGS